MAKLRAKLNDILVSVSWGEIAMNYFDQKPSWLYHKLEIEAGNEEGFTDEELFKFKGALCNLADRIIRVSESL